MSHKVVTLYIDDTSLKLLVAQGKEIKKWAVLPLEPGLVSDGVITDPALLADKLKQLLNAQRVMARNVIPGLSGLHCLSRVITLPSLPKAVLAEAVNRQAEKLLPIAIEELYISWRIIHYSKQEIKVFLVAYPRNVLDALIKTLRQAGIKPYLIDLAPLAIARVVNKATAVIADVRSSEMDIVVILEGIPELIRSLPLSIEAVSLQGELPIVRDELERTIKFYDSMNPEKPLDSDVPIYVSGKLIEKPELCQSLSNELGHPVLSMSSPLKCPEGLEVAQYMVNIGLALKNLWLGKRADLSALTLDVTPQIYQPKPPSLTKVLIVPGIIAAICLFFPLVMLVGDTATDTASIKTQLDYTNQLVQQRFAQQQSQNKEIAELKDTIAEVEATHDIFSAVLRDFDLQWWPVNHHLEATTNSLTPTINLTGIEHNGDMLTIRGRAPSETQVLSYATSLCAECRFSKTSIASMKKDENGEIEFTLVFTK